MQQRRNVATSIVEGSAVVLLSVYVRILPAKTQDTTNNHMIRQTISIEGEINKQRCTDSRDVIVAFAGSFAE
jgi:CRISPR/Cas system-associated protein endoribonuclease Cas2